MSTIVYHSRPFTKYRWVSFYCGFYFAIVSVGLFLKPLRHKKIDDSEKPKTTVVTLNGTIDNFKNDLSIKNIYLNLKHDPLLTMTQLLGSLAIPALAFFYVKRMVHEIAIIPGGKARIATFSPFPFTKPKFDEVPIAHISCITSRKSNHNYAVLKVKDFFGYHLIHKQEGIIEHPELFDKYLGYERAWPKTRASLLQRIGLKK